MKNTWAELDKQLKNQKILNNNILQEMTKTKTGKAVNRLINYTYFGMIIIVFAIGLVVNRMTSIYFGPFKILIFALIILFLLAGLIMGVSNLILLQKINFLQPVTENIRLTNQYKIRTKKQLLSSYFCAIFIVILTIIAAAISFNMEAWRWIVIFIAVIIGIIGSIWEYKRMYKKNVEIIQSSLEELKELEEEN